MNQGNIRLVHPADQKENPGPDRREMLLGAGLELSRRALECKSLDELSYLLTNDTRALLEYDRAYLIIHLGGVSQIGAIGNQPVVDKKSAFYEILMTLGSEIKNLEKPLLLSMKSDLDKITPDLLDPEIKAGILKFLQFSQGTGVFASPLKSDNEIVGHLIYEFLDDRMPDQLSILNLINLSHFFGSAIAKRWALTQNPELVPLTSSHHWTRKWFPEQSYPRLKLAAAIILTILLVLFVIPIPFNIGGEAEVVPRQRIIAFAQTEGIVQKIFVVEGTKVDKGQLIAKLDPTEPLHRVTIARRQVELLSNEEKVLQRAAGENITKLAESQLAMWKFRKAQAELNYLEWQLRFLEIKAPVAGIVVTKQIETLIGKKFKPGEPFCEIVAPGDLCTDIYVPEDRMAFIETGQKATLSLNSDPLGSYPLKITEIAPRSEATPRMGNIVRVRGEFTQGSPRFSVGQKGTGSISTGNQNLWFIMKSRLGVRINELSHYLW